MKNRNVSLLAILAVAIIAISACKKTNNPLPGPGSISFIFDTTNSVKFENAGGTYGTNTGIFQFSAYTPASNIEFSVGPNFTAGSFDIASGKASIIYTAPLTNEAASSDNVYTATSGTVVITSYSTTAVTGTFAFKGKNLSGTACVADSGTFITGYTRSTTYALPL